MSMIRWTLSRSAASAAILLASGGAWAQTPGATSAPATPAAATSEPSTAPAAQPPATPPAGALPANERAGAARDSAAAEQGGTGDPSRDYVDTRITWTFGDDDVLASTGQRVPVSPLPRIGDRQQYQLFFDALNSRFAGRENLTHLVLYARAPGFIPRIQTEASLVLRVDLGQLSTGSGNLNQAFYDAGTFIRLAYALDPGRPRDNLSVTFFPFDTDRFRLGYLWDLSWGGSTVFPRRVGPAPGVRVQVDVGGFSAWAGFKTAGIVVPLEVVTQSRDIEVVRVEETNYGALGGLSYRAGDLFRFDLSGGWFQQGRFDFPGVRGQGVYVYGASARAVFTQGMRVSQSLDMMLYRNDPTAPFVAFQPESYSPGRLQWAVSAEGVVLRQNLANIDNPGRTEEQTAFAGALQARLKAGYFGLGLTGLYRTVPFILRDVPSFVPFQTIPTDATVNGELFFAAEASYAFTRAHIVPSLIMGLQLPATFSTSVREGSLESLRTLVIRRAGNFSILPPGEDAVPIFSARLSVRWDLSRILAGVVWVQYVLDQNSTLLQVDASGTRQVRIFQDANQLGFGVTAQARF